MAAKDVNATPPRRRGGLGLVAAVGVRSGGAGAFAARVARARESVLFEEVADSGS